MLPSFLCLDAPLVALGWAVLIGRENGAPHSATAPLALFLAVWTIYLADRLSDALRSENPEDLPPRHRFAKRNWRGLTALAFILIAILLSVFAPRLEREVYLEGAALGLLAVIYFLAFRVWRTPSRFPAKEFIIGLSFALGALVAADQFNLTAPTILIGIALTAIFLANCLAISLAESDYDSVSDPAAHFAQRPGSAKLPTALLIVSVLGSVGLFFLHGFQKTAASIVAGALFTAILIFRSGHESDHFQPIADAILLVPWVFLAFDLTGLGH